MNTYATCSIVAKEAVAVLENMCSFSKAVNRDWEQEFTGNMARGYAPGNTINIPKPPRYTYRSGRVSSPQATVETTIPLTLAQGGTDLSFYGIDRTLSLKRLEGKMQAAMASVANEIDRQGLALVNTAVFNAVGTVGTPPATQAAALALLTSANQRLDEMGAPRDKQRQAILSPSMNGSLIQGLAGLFNAQSVLGKQYGSGMMVDSLGLAYAMDQNVQTLTNGTQATTGVTVNGAGQSGATILVNTASVTGTIRIGSVITFASVFAVNPQSRQSTGALAQFVVTGGSTVVGDLVSAAATSLTVSPALVTSGAFQNVTGSPANTAGVTILGAASATYTNNVAFHKDAFTLAMVPMYAPPSGKGVIDVAQEEYNGFRVKVTEFYDGTQDNYIMRLDVLFGWAATYPELAVKVVA